MQIVSRHVGRSLVFLASAAVLVATLFPSDQPGSSPPLCILCGDRGVADGIVNVILFVPLGAAIALLGGSTQRALVTSALLSVAVEAAQFLVVPGRDASLSDLLFNTLGGAAGVLAVRKRSLWLRPTTSTAARLSLLAGFFILAAVAATGWLYVPRPTGRPYYVSWTPDLAHLERYDGVVRSASMGGTPLEPGRFERPLQLRALVRERAPIEVHLTAGSQVSRLSALVSIHDEDKNEILLLGPERDRLVFRVRTRAAFFRLDQPDFRIYHLFRSIRPGQDVVISTRQQGRAVCLGVAPRISCTAGLTAGSGWGLLLFIEEWPEWLHATLNCVWIAALSFPVGLWLRKRWESAAACVALALALTLMPPAVNLETTPPQELLGALAGLLAGTSVARSLASLSKDSEARG